MSHNDDFREVPPPEPTSAEDQFVPVAPDPLPLPAPEPLVAAEPPPDADPDAPVDRIRVPPPVTPVQAEPSWRNLVGSRRTEHPWATPVLAQSREQDAPADGVGSDPADSMGPRDNTIGTLGDEPMGGNLRDEPAAPPVVPLVPGDGTADSAVRRDVQSSVTLSRISEELFAWLKTLASAAVYATLIVTFGFQVARVEGQSMAPTLADQDRLIVNKLAYRLGQPQVGDIVMLYYPLNPDKSFVKRVIAEEGDQIRIVDGRVYRNDVPINDDYVPPEFRSHDDWGPEVVPQGYYFVMGDHRNNSSDSRHWRFVPKKYIIGKVQLRWWPLPHARIF